MQKLISQLEARPGLTEPQRWNLCREVLQVLVLKAIYAAPDGQALAFQGGTCLRICHGLRRYSEGLDFSLVQKTPGYSFKRLYSTVARQLALEGFDVDGKAHDEKTVQKAFIRISGLAPQLKMAIPENQKLSIKIEVDVHPPKKGRWDSFFVSRFGELYPVLKYDLPTLYSGKALAVLLRPYERGRDYFDLLWYLGQKISGNVEYFNSGLKQAHARAPVRDWNETLDLLAAKTARLNTAALVKDLRPFLEDSKDLTLLERYSEVFAQLLNEQPGRSS